VSLALPRPTILDRYVVREVLPPTGLGLLLFTFILLLDQITNLMKVLVSRGADLATVARAFAYLLPSIFSVTIPMAFLLGVLLAFGRLASDSEIVALRASGVSPARLLRPVLGLSLARRSSPSTCSRSGPGLQPGLPRDPLLPDREQGPHRDEAAGVHRRPRARHGAVRVGHPRAAPASGRTSSSTTRGSRGSLD
jgi:hypothetical protein